MSHTIDVVFPIGSAGWVPYLANACRFVRAQNYPQEKIGIVVSYLYSKVEPLSDLADVCREYDATLVMSRADADDGFRTPLCRNRGIRRTARDVLALIDSDVCLHPHTFTAAAQIVGANQGVILPVADMPQGPEAPLFQTTDPAVATAISRRDGTLREAAMGALIVPRKAVMSVRGYDERMAGWGADDTDFGERLRMYGGVNLALRHDFPWALHQHHPASNRESEQNKLNRRLYFEGGEHRNVDGWGGIPG